VPPLRSTISLPVNSYWPSVCRQSGTIQQQPKLRLKHTQTITFNCLHCDSIGKPYRIHWNRWNAKPNPIANISSRCNAVRFLYQLIAIGLLFAGSQTQYSSSPSWVWRTSAVRCNKLCAPAFVRIETNCVNWNLLVPWKVSIIQTTNTMHKFATVLYSYMVTPTCFSSSLLSSGSFWIRLNYVKLQIDMVVYHILWLSGLCVGVSWFGVLCCTAECLSVRPFDGFVGKYLDDNCWKSLNFVQLSSKTTQHNNSCQIGDTSSYVDITNHTYR
jgi:hypothetical protein